MDSRPTMWSALPPPTVPPPTVPPPILPQPILPRPADDGSAPGDPGGRLGLLVEQLTARRDRQRHATARAASDLADFARTGRAPCELRAVQERIDRGELTWEQVVGGGSAAHLDAGARSDVEAVRELCRVPLSDLPRVLADARTRMERDGLDPAEAARQRQ